MKLRVTDSVVHNMLTFELSPDQVRYFNAHCRSATTGEVINDNLDNTLTLDIKGDGRIVLPIRDVVIVTCTNTRSTTIGFDVDKSDRRTLFKELQATPNVHYLLTIKSFLSGDKRKIGFSAKAEVLKDA